MEDLSLLIKLSYCPSYVKDGAKLLQQDVLLRLAAIANAYEFVECLQECMNHVASSLTLEQAMTIMEELPFSLLELDLAKKIRSSAMQKLSRGLDIPYDEGRPEREALLTKAADALTKYLGPIRDLFTPQAILSKWSAIHFTECLILDPFVKVSRIFCICV